MSKMNNFTPLVLDFSLEVLVRDFAYAKSMSLRDARLFTLKHTILELRESGNVPSALLFGGVRYRLSDYYRNRIFKKLNWIEGLK